MANMLHTCIFNAYDEELFKLICKEEQLSADLRLMRKRIDERDLERMILEHGGVVHIKLRREILQMKQDIDISEMHMENLQMNMRQRASQIIRRLRSSTSISARHYALRPLMQPVTSSATGARNVNGAGAESQVEDLCDHVSASTVITEPTE